MDVEFFKSLDEKLKAQIQQALDLDQKKEKAPILLRLLKMRVRSYSTEEFCINYSFLQKLKLLDAFISRALRKFFQFCMKTLSLYHLKQRYTSTQRLSSLQKAL